MAILGQYTRCVRRILLRRLSPKANQTTTKALREAVKRIVVQEVDEVLDADERGASAATGGRGLGRGAEGVGRVRGRGKIAARGRGRLEVEAGVLMPKFVHALAGPPCTNY